MPGYPHFSERTDRLPASVFEKFRLRMKEAGPELVHLHIGDTYLHPYFQLPIDETFLKKTPYFNHYCNTFGVQKFRRAVSEKLREDNGFTITADNILSTSGATNALSASVMTVLNPGEKILILTPCWPFFPGMVKIAGAAGIQVPFYHLLYRHPDMNIGEYLENYLSEDTAALYLNTPNNPSGKVLDRNQLQQLADFCRSHNLWIISDEAYDGLLFDNREHICIGTLPGMFDKTLSIFTFSKSFMFAGLRLGYLVAAEEVIKSVNKTLVHQLYSPSTLSQYMMVEPLRKRQDWIPRLCREYQDLRDRFVSGLNISIEPPEGTYFLFFSIKDHLGRRNYWQVIEQFLDAGVSVAPGGDFGEGFEDYIRICFTGEPPKRLEKAIDRLNAVLGEAQ